MIIWHSTVPTSCYIFFGIPIFIDFPTYSVGKSSNWRRSETINILSQRTCKYVSIKCIFLFSCFLVWWSLLNILCLVLNFSAWLCQWQCFLILNFGLVYLCQYNLDVFFQLEFSLNKWKLSFSLKYHINLIFFLMWHSIDVLF